MRMCYEKGIKIVVWSGRSRKTFHLRTANPRKQFQRRGGLSSWQMDALERVGVVCFCLYVQCRFLFLLIFARQTYVVQK